MSAAEELSTVRSRRLLNPRTFLIALGLLFMFVLVFGRAIARFYVDYLWHDALGRGDVFWGVIFARVTLFAALFIVFAAIASLNLWIADRVAPSVFPANVHPYVERFHEVFGRRLRLVRYLAALVLALMLALPGTARWQDWLLFRNSQEFGIPDPQFGADVGFYVFQLPFLSFLLDWLFASLVLVFILTAVAHVLNGGVQFTAPIPTLRTATKNHAAILLAVLALAKAGDYWLDRYDLTNTQRGIVQGATYSVVNAQLPALMLLLLIAVLTAGLYASVVRTGSWRLPILASALWLVVSIIGGVIYPSIVQGLIVNPNQRAREAEFIERNVNATRAALGIEQVNAVEVEFGSLTASEIESDLEPLRNARLLSPRQMRNKFEFDRAQDAGLGINDLDIDRYEIDGSPEQVLVAARELDLQGITNTSWQGRHLINTRGCGLLIAPAGQVFANDEPVYTNLDLERPELYFSPSLSGYAIANTEASERTCDEPHQYEGRSGVALSSILRRAAFALAFLDYNVFGTSSVNDESQMLWVRNVNDRLDKLAPFLSYDADPYPVDYDGRAVWIVDAYTTSTGYPYGQSIGDIERSASSGLSDADNYVRNSVKAIVDAYTGEVTLYVIDPDDPIIRAWQSAFPDLFSPIEDMPTELREHLRYPEDLFRIQTDVYSKYRLDPALFFDRDGNAWSVAQAPGDQRRITQTGTGEGNNSAPVAINNANVFATESDTARFEPYYTMFDDGAGGEEFVILRPFVPFSTDDTLTQLQAYMTASSDPDTYGELRVFIYPGTPEDLPDGPARIATQAEAEELISARIAADSIGETEVIFGDLQLIPVGDSLLWIRPYYVQIQQSGGANVTQFEAVILAYNDDSVIADTITAGIRALFPGFDADVGDRISVLGDDRDEPVDGDTTDGETDPDTTDEGTDGGTPVAGDLTAVELLAAADEAFQAADQALANGDLGEYQAQVSLARELIAELEAQLGGG